MNPENAGKVLAALKDDDLVLDVGGWMKPFPRADYVMDIMPYETRGLLGSVHPGPERFTRSTWIVRDFCDRDPWPFPDRHFDFAICSHVLEDIRDPVFVCSELRRVAKAGYIETPSRLVEQRMGIESDKYPGYCHHRWLIESSNNSLTFTMKNARISSSWRMHLPARASRQMKPLSDIAFLFWKDDFEFGERVLITVEEIEADLERVVRGSGVYSQARYSLWRNARKARNLAKRMVKA